MNYKTYAEAKIANPESEIVTTGRDWSSGGEFIGTFEARIAPSTEHTWRHFIGDESWVICNPADHCSTIKEVLEAGFNLYKGDLFLGKLGRVDKVGREIASINSVSQSELNSHILSATALNGGCKIPSKTEQWTVYNNTLPLCELTDEQVGAIFRYGIEKGVIEVMDDNGKWWDNLSLVGWHTALAYRAKQKSERELFIENTTKVMRYAGTKCPDNHEYFGIMFDAGARYKDLTQHFGENI